MIDEIFEKIVDDLCVRVPAFCKPRLIAVSATALGWRFNLYVGTAVRGIVALTKQVHTDAGLEAFFQEKLEQQSGFVQALRRAERRFDQARIGFLMACRTKRFALTLYLLLLSVLGLCAVGGAQMAACAASLCMLWLSVAMEEEYAPVCSGVRQRYLASVLLRGMCMLPLLFRFYVQYAHLGVRNNVVLQSAMVIMLFVHVLSHLTLVAFNKRQPVLLRALAGVLGAVPALTASAAIAAAFTVSGGLNMVFAGAVLGALGAVLAFAGDQLETLVAIGGIRLKWQDAYLLLLTATGYLMMIAGAWLAA